MLLHFFPWSLSFTFHSRQKILQFLSSLNFSKQRTNCSTHLIHMTNIFPPASPTPSACSFLFFFFLLLLFFFNIWEEKEFQRIKCKKNSFELVRSWKILVLAGLMIAEEFPLSHCDHKRRICCPVALSKKFFLFFSFNLQKLLQQPLKLRGRGRRGRNGEEKSKKKEKKI